VTELIGTFDGSASEPSDGRCAGDGVVLFIRPISPVFFSLT
jgi:hypothetical protein